MVRTLLLFIGLTAFAVNVSAQEMDCSVGIDYSSLSGSDYTFLDDLRDRVDEYVNRQFFTEDRFQEFERIDCSINMIVVEALSLTSYRARIVVASRRPIYGSTQNTQILQINDEEWVFDYTQGATLTSNRDVYDPITTLLDYYVLLILGYDYDSYSELGGTPYFERARIAADLAKNASGRGWDKLGGDRGRTTIVEEVLDPRFRELRLAYYKYHLQGLDLFVSKIEDARVNILESIQALKTVYDSNARSYVMDLFFAAKYKEVVAVLRESPVGGEAYDMLAEMDLQHVADYEALIQ